MGQWSVYCLPPSPPCLYQKILSHFLLQPPNCTRDLGTGNTLATLGQWGRLGTGDVCAFFTSIPISDVKYQIKTWWRIYRENTEGRESFSLALVSKMLQFFIWWDPWKLCSPPWPLAPQSLFPYLLTTQRQPAPQIDLTYTTSLPLISLRTRNVCLILCWFPGIRASRKFIIFNRMNIQSSLQSLSLSTLCDPSTLYPSGLISLSALSILALEKAHLYHFFLDSTCIH